MRAKQVIDKVGLLFGFFVSVHSLLGHENSPSVQIESYIPLIYIVAEGIFLFERDEWIESRVLDKAFLYFRVNKIS